MKQDVLNAVENAVKEWLGGQGVIDVCVTIERSSSPQFGEYASNVALRYAKELNNSPLEIANNLANFLNEKDIAGIRQFEAVAPGFLNIHLAADTFWNNVTFINTDSTFGNNNERNGEKWVIEHTSPNPNKAMHLGHLRNNLVGMGIVRLLERSGAEVVSDCIYNDRGIAIAKVMYGYLSHMRKSTDTRIDIAYWNENRGEWFTPEEREQKPDLFVTECYVEGEKAMADSSAEAATRQMVVDWENGDGATLELWKYVLSIAYDGIDRTLGRLGNHWDKIWYEHEHYKEGKQYVTEGLEKDVFSKLEDGAIITKLEEQYGIPDTVVLKKDGTSLYITQDIALTDLKKKTYGAQKLVWVVGPEQSLAFKQMFAVCEQLGIGKVDDFAHVTYGYVGLKDEDGSFKKMSSRAGTVVLIDDVIDEVKAVIHARLVEDNRHEGSEADELAEKLALAAVKFSFLRSDRNQDISFDISQSVDVHGDSGMYVMYSFVRTQSIIEKFTGDISTIQTPDNVQEEGSVLRTLLYYPEVIKKAQDDLSVHHVAQYLLELCGEFNSWYAKETILDGSDEEVNKVALVSAVSTVLKDGMSILGIDTVSRI